MPTISSGAKTASGAGCGARRRRRKVNGGSPYGVSFWDLFALTVLFANIPAGRAAAISPMSALRTE
jgi:hypothetical protein